MNHHLLVLTLVDTFTGWIESFPASRERADVEAQVLVEHIIPQFGMLESVQADNSPAVTSRVTEPVSKAPNICKFHIPYHPQSLGKLERASGLLEQLTRLSGTQVALALSFFFLSP